ncbi:hypothetical protein ACHQM5_009493 [Ranunculus cassubicifolius]
MTGEDKDGDEDGKDGHKKNEDDNGRGFDKDSDGNGGVYVKDDVGDREGNDGADKVSDVNGEGNYEDHCYKEAKHHQTDMSETIPEGGKSAGAEEGGCSEDIHEDVISSMSTPEILKLDRSDLETPTKGRTRSIVRCVRMRDDRKDAKNDDFHYFGLGR